MADIELSIGLGRVDEAQAFLGSLPECRRELRERVLSEEWQV